jgi:hypothetical protein
MYVVFSFYFFGRPADSGRKKWRWVWVWVSCAFFARCEGPAKKINGPPSVPHALAISNTYLPTNYHFFLSCFSGV